MSGYEYYSSDGEEDICWGPRTLREVKRDLRGLQLNKPIDRRRTVGVATPPKIVEPTPGIVIDDISSLVADVSKVASCSKYFTPDITMASSESKYETPNETVNMEHQQQHGFIDRLTDALNSPAVGVKKTDYALLKGTSTFEKALMETMLSPNVGKLENFRLTMMEPISSESEDEASTSTVNNIIKGLYENDSCQKDESHNFIINLTSDSEDEQTESQYTNVDEDSVEHQISTVEQSINISDSSDDFENHQEINSSDITDLDGTLEEMERILAGHLNTRVMSPQHSLVDRKKSIISSSSKKQRRTSLPSVPSKKSSPLRETIQCSSVSKAGFKSKLKPPTIFRKPEITKDIGIEFKAPKPVKPVKNSFDHIRSPVAVYIKNSGTTPLQRKAPMKPLAQVSPKLTSQVKQDTSFKSVAYKPHGELTVRGKENALPSNINKMIHHTELAKHLSTNRRDTCLAERILEEEDLTFASHQSLDSTGEEMSILLSQKAII